MAENTGLLSIGTDTSHTSEVSEEFSLPDYVAEIRRVLSVVAEALPEGRYIEDKGDNSSLELNGSVTYSVIYLDDEGKLFAIPLNSSYQTRLPISLGTKSLSYNTTVESVSCRVMAKRKLSLKSRLKTRVLSFVDARLPENVGGSSADQLFIERDNITAKAMSIIPCTLDGIRISDRLETPQGKEITPLWCDAKAMVYEARAQAGTVSVRAEALVKCLVSSEGELSVIEKRLPLNEIIEAEGAESDDMVRVEARCVSLSISNEESDKSNQLFFDLTCELFGEVIKSLHTTLTKDAYSTKNEMELSYKDIPIYRGVKATNASITLSQAIKKENEQAERVIEIFANPVYEKTEIKGTKAYVCGRVNVSVLLECALNEAGEREYTAQAYEIPFRQEIEVGRASGEAVPFVSLIVSNQNGKAEGDSIYTSMELYTSLALYDKSTERALERCQVRHDKEIVRDNSQIRVYFPKDGDTLWEIAKAYHTTKGKIMAENGLSGEEIPSGGIIV
ncbi:MAG: DUF3794 domain-containing protein [Clostridia bacterium]|nr:DUF3794 domain-containing protein [Clostridia bacterium]